MDKFGQGVEFKYSMLNKNKELSFAGFTEQMLLEMCILSGCDYLQSLPGMGLKRAHALMKKLKSYDKVNFIKYAVHGHLFSILLVLVPCTNTKQSLFLFR